MINSNAILPLISNLAVQPGNTPAKRNTGERFSSDFKDMLSSAVDRTYTGQNAKRTYNVANVEKSTNGKEPQSQIKSYNEAAASRQCRPSNNKAINSSKDNGTGFSGKEVKAQNEDGGMEEEVLKEALAKVLGITENELSSLLAALNINSRELTDNAYVEEVAQKISDFIGLSSDQQKTLSQILSMIQDEVQHSIGDSRVFLNAAGNTEKNTAKEEWIELKGIDVEVVEEKGEIADRIGRALNQLKDISLEHPDKLISHISAKVQDAVKNSINPEEAASLQVTEKEEGLLVEDESGNSSDELEKTELKDRKKGIETGELRDNKVFVSESEDIVGDKSVTLSYDVSQKEVQDTGFSQTVESKAPVSKQEIFTQVVEKAKVLLSGEKSEMVIDLKPDHLGKLALKIATERGIVVAKFIAENEQVKAALESNMNMLKESLEKQGFLVQEFSVSVGDNRERSGYEDNMKKGNFAKKGLKDELPAIGMVGVESLEQLHTGINSYIDGTSSINLTA